MGKPKRYKIKLLSDVLDVPEDKFEDFLEDFKTFYKFGRATHAIGQVVEPDMPASKMLKGTGMTWIDDGEHGLRKITVKPHPKSNSKEYLMPKTTDTDKISKCDCDQPEHGGLHSVGCATENGL